MSKTKKFHKRTEIDNEVKVHLEKIEFYRDEYTDNIEKIQYFDENNKEILVKTEHYSYEQHIEKVEVYSPYYYSIDRCMYYRPDNSLDKIVYYNDAQASVKKIKYFNNDDTSSIKECHYFKENQKLDKIKYYN